MGKHFIQIQRRTRLSAAIAALGIGLGAAILAVAILLGVTKLAGLPLDPLLYLLAPAAFLITAGICCLLFIPSDRRLAKRLDEEHDLQEKARTMVAFAAEDGSFAKLQREDADRRLGALHIPFFRKRQLLALLVLLGVSLGCLTGAVLVPDRSGIEPGEETIDNYLKSMIIADLNDLIAMVKKSLIADALKASTLTALTDLLEFVEAHDYMSEMKTKAVSTVLSINRTLKRENTAPTIGEKLADSQTALLRECGAALASLSAGKVKGLLEDLKDNLASAPGEDVSFVGDEIEAAIRQAGADGAQTFTVLMNRLAAGLKSYANAAGDLDAAFSDIPMKASTELMLQTVNKTVIQTVISRLCERFGITQDDLTEVEGGEEIDTRPPVERPGDDGETPDAQEPDKEMGGGGMGTGDRVYGSNDMIYDPDTNTYVTYGTLLDAYNASAIEKVNDNRINADFAKFIEEYFKTLSDPNANKGEQ